MWLSANRICGHMEGRDTHLFTGDGPGERYQYVSKNKGTALWSGENALYSGRSYETAEQIAQEAFEIWRSSPGHNSNMLAAGHLAHGVAFVINTQGEIYATDLFCRSVSYSALLSEPPENLAIKSASLVVKPITYKDGFVSASDQNVKVNLSITAEKIKELLYSSTGPCADKLLVKAAQCHAEYMAANRKVCHEEIKGTRKYYSISLNKRIRRASFGMRFFRPPSSRYVESIALITADTAALNIDSIARVSIAALDKERGNLSGNTKSIGYGVKIQRTKNELKIYIVREELIRCK